MEGAQEQRGRGQPVYAIQQQIVAFNTERTRHKQAYQTHVQAIEHLLTTKPRLCQNASHKMSLTAAADMKLRYTAMMYTRAKTLARQELDQQQDQVGGQPVVEAALAKTSSSRQSSQNMPTMEHCMDLEEALPASHSRPHSTAYNSKDERQARTGKGEKIQNTSSSKRSSSCRNSRSSRSSRSNFSSGFMPDLVGTSRNPCSISASGKR